jgi:hypothetical protein
MDHVLRGLVPRLDNASPHVPLGWHYGRFVHLSRILIGKFLERALNWSRTITLWWAILIHVVLYDLDMAPIWLLETWGAATGPRFDLASIHLV